MASNTVANAVKATITKKPFWANASKIVAIGRNYAYCLFSFESKSSNIRSDHITELGNQRPSKPIYFLKPLSSVYFRPPINKPREKEKDVIFIPHDVNVHYEVELGIIMRHDLWNLGHSRKTLSPENFEKRWNDAISGYFIGTKTFHFFFFFFFCGG
jgi:2-keto-4-pentenoate hydratase/2-oxohepta-3-ene-1,7-dioic acid hydratase in catechol pathway